MEGWIKLHRTFLKWEWYDDINTKVLFMHLLLTVNHTSKRWHGIEIGAGQGVYGLPKLSKECGLSISQARTSLNKLKLTGEIAVKSTNKFSLLTIVKWEEYQSDDRQITNELTGNLAVGSQSSDIQIATNKNEKNEKKEGESRADTHDPTPPVQNIEKKVSGMVAVNIQKRLEKGKKISEEEREILEKWWLQQGVQPPPLEQSQAPPDPDKMVKDLKWKRDKWKQILTKDEELILAEYEERMNKNNVLKMA